MEVENLNISSNSKNKSKHHKRSKTYVSSHISNIQECDILQDKLKKYFDDPKTYFEFKNTNLIIGKEPSGPKFLNNEVIPHSIIGANLYNKSISNPNSQKQELRTKKQHFINLAIPKLSARIEESSRIKQENKKTTYFIDDLNLSKIYDEQKEIETKNNENVIIYFYITITRLMAFSIMYQKKYNEF